MREYVLISQDRYKIEKSLEHEAWTLFEESNPAESIDLPSINCSLKLAEDYDRVKFG